MIKVHGTGQTLVRETTCNFEYLDPKTGESKIEEIRVRYFLHTVAKTREIALQRKKVFEQAQKDKEPVWLSEILPFELESLPDLAGENGKPLSITSKALEQISRQNLEAIAQAIADDQRPKEQPSK